MGLLFPFTQHLFLPVTPSIKAEFGTSDVITQLTVSVPSFIMAVMTLAYGSLSDRLGRRRVLITGILLFTAGGFMTAFATSIWQLILGRLIQGAGGACGMVLARAIARDIFGMDGLVKIIAILTMTISIGSMIAPPLGGFLVDYAGWRSVMFCATGIGVVAMLLAAAVLYETH
ncbi:MAG: MFS transporter, partial [Pseudomonadota bacterium]|nr:MFS transporter [Pseudomonadota bacterium]